MAHLDSSGIPTKDIEAMLGKVSGTPALETEFHKLLLEATVYLVTPSDQSEPTFTIMDRRKRVEVQRWRIGGGSLVIPFFSSPAALRSAVETMAGLSTRPATAGHKRIKADIEWHVMAARKLFKMTLGHPLILNPYCPHCAQFLPGDVDLLLR